MRKLRLNADVTVLSACKTGSGKLVVGEGVLGMSRSFLLAGSRRTVVSLWSVASKETEELMVHFYNGLVRGNAVSEALRLAAMEIRRTRPHPFFWAPFVAVGG